MTTILQDLETYATRVEGGISKDLEALGAKLASVWAVEEPYAKAFLALLFQQETKDAVSAGIAAVLQPTPTVTGVLAAVSTAVVSSVAANAEADVQTEIKAAQTAGAIPVSN